MMLRVIKMLMMMLVIYYAADDDYALLLLMLLRVDMRVIIDAREGVCYAIREEGEAGAMIKCSNIDA